MQQLHPVKCCCCRPPCCTALLFKFELCFKFEYSLCVSLRGVLTCSTADVEGCSGRSLQVPFVSANLAMCMFACSNAWLLLRNTKDEWSVRQGADRPPVTLQVLMYGLTAGAKWAARGLFVALLLMGLYWCFFYKLQVKHGMSTTMCCLCLCDSWLAC